MALGEMWRAAGLAKLNVRIVYPRRFPIVPSLSWRLPASFLIHRLRNWQALTDYMRDLLGASGEEGSDSGGKMLVFAHHLAVLDEAQKVAVNARVGFVRIDGSTSQADRHRLLGDN